MPEIPEIRVHTTFSKAGEPIGLGNGTLKVQKSALRTSQKGSVYVYMTVPVLVTDEDGKGLIRTMAAGSLILRAAPVLE